jgi:hypothetical protein
MKQKCKFQKEIRNKHETKQQSIRRCGGCDKRAVENEGSFQFVLNAFLGVSSHTKMTLIRVFRQIQNER